MPPIQCTYVYNQTPYIYTIMYNILPPCEEGLGDVGGGTGLKVGGPI